MSATVARLCGQAWQDWANLLLSRHYGPAEYQRIPDNQKGDAGIEGFSVNTGHVYQAYGCEEPISTAARYEKHRVKITTDIGKFVTNQTVLGKLFGTTKITRWVLFVPYFDSKEIVAHAATKTDEVLRVKLAYVGAGFRVMVCDEEQFQAERDALINSTTEFLHIQADPATNDQITGWATTNDGQTTTLEDKVRRLPTLDSAKQLREFRDRVVKWYLEGQGILTTLRKYPAVYEKVVRAKSHRENYLASSSILEGGSSAEVFRAALNGLLETFKNEVKELSALSLESLAHEAVADWLLRCPLDFPEVGRHV